MTAHRVVALCLEGVVAFDLAAPAQAFGGAHRPGGEPLYEFTTCSLDGAEVWTTSGFGITPTADLDVLQLADTIVVPGYFGILAPPPAPALVALRAAGERGARMLSVCTGAFALAQAGLLDGRRATTHWTMAAVLARRFPAVAVEPDRLYIDEDEVMTSGGLSAGVDLCLHVIRKDFGAAAGERVARHMVAAPHREGGQAQFSKPAVAQQPTIPWLTYQNARGGVIYGGRPLGRPPVSTEILRRPGRR